MLVRPKAFRFSTVIFHINHGTRLSKPYGPDTPQTLGPPVGGGAIDALQSDKAMPRGRAYHPITGSED